MPLELINNKLDFFAFYVSSKQGATGLTVTVDIYKNVTSSNSSTLILSNQSANEIGGGLYKYQLASASNDSEGEYLAIFKTSSSVPDQKDIPAIWVVNKSNLENLDATVSSRISTGSGGIVYTATVTSSATSLPLDNVATWITTDVAGSNIVAGTLYTNASGQVSFTLDAGSYYIWFNKDNINFTNPQAITVS